MNGGEGWRSMRSAAVGQDKTMINTLMLRFRPIAPKPATGGPMLGRSPTLKDQAIVSLRRPKRKYVRVRRSCKESNKDRERTVAKEVKSMSATTLQLLEENRAEQKVSSKGGAWCSASTSVYSHTVTVIDKEEEEASNPFIRLNLNLNLMNNDGKEALVQTAVMPPPRKTVETWVTVEYVRETCMEALGLGCTDAEKLANLGGDTCPGFVSDGLDRIVWVNRAFRKMVMSLNNEEQQEETPEMEVRLVMRGPLAYSAFTCQVKVQYTWGKEKCSQMVPCDAWRIDGGGFAWRLDVKAALSLGR